MDEVQGQYRGKTSRLVMPDHFGVNGEANQDAAGWLAPEVTRCFPSGKAQVSLSLAAANAHSWAELLGILGRIMPKRFPCSHHSHGTREREDSVDQAPPAFLVDCAVVFRVIPLGLAAI